MYACCAALGEYRSEHLRNLCWPGRDASHLPPELAVWVVHSCQQAIQVTCAQITCQTSGHYWALCRAAQTLGCIFPFTIHIRFVRNKGALVILRRHAYAHAQQGVSGDELW